MEMVPYLSSLFLSSSKFSIVLALELRHVEPSLIIEVNQGRLQGREKTSVLTGKPYYSFQGIPYAKPPLGELRFQTPVPAGKWEGIYDATFERSSCTQVKFDDPQEVVGEEDCLYINIETPEIPSKIKTPKAVMVFIHGGAFSIGSGSEVKYSADFLIGNDIILVTFNYRLHILGFLNLGIPECPGNAGFNDQFLALQWVKKNIAKFGGDPENITIFGQSAGAVSVHYQVITPLYKNITRPFKRAIMESGSVLVPFALANDPHAVAFDFGRLLGFSGDDKEELLKFLKHKTNIELNNKLGEYENKLQEKYVGSCGSFAFLPSIETIENGAFLPDLPENLLKEAEPLPIIFGVTETEGIMATNCKFYLKMGFVELILILYPVLDDNGLKKIDENFSFVLINNFKIYNHAELPQLSKKIRDYYFGNKTIEYETIDLLMDMYSDLFFFRFYESIKFVTNSIFPVYVYEFTYHGGLCQNFPNNISGVGHGDDIKCILYDKSVDGLPKTESDRKVIDQITEMWSHFAKTGNPSDDWKPFIETEPVYMRINAESKLERGTIYGERLQFLKNTLNGKAEPYNRMTLFT